MSQNQSWSLLIDIWRATEQKGRRSPTLFERERKTLPSVCVSVCVYIDSHTLPTNPLPFLTQVGIVCSMGRSWQLARSAQALG